jgi:hypothetical protein
MSGSILALYGAMMSRAVKGKDFNALSLLIPVSVAVCLSVYLFVSLSVRLSVYQSDYIISLTAGCSRVGVTIRAWS